MTSQHVNYLLIGGGVANSAAAAAIRQSDPVGSILLVSREIVRPYRRPLLSKSYLRRESTREALFTHDRDFFEKNQIELRTASRAARIDAERRAVFLDQGDVIGYDQLLLSTGMIPCMLQIPGAALPGVYYLRTLEDAARLHTTIDKATQEGLPRDRERGGGRRGIVVVIGAGLLGVEVAASLAQCGLGVHLICAGAHPWDRIAGEMTGRTIAARLERGGVRVRTGSAPIRLEGDGRVQRVVLNDGSTIACDFVIPAIGAEVNRELLRGTPIAAERAILVDECFRSSVANIFAAGDCAAVFDPLFGKHRLIDHDEHAAASGAIAGRNMAGGHERFGGVSHFCSELFDLTPHVWGEARLVDRRVVRADPARDEARPGLIEFGVAADGRLAQIIAIGHEQQSERFAQLIAARLDVNGLEEELKDPHSPIP